MANTLNIIKIGGAILEDPQSLQSFASSIAHQRQPMLIVHGGGRTASNISERLGIQPLLIEGRRITDADTLDVVTMVYAGLLNKKLVAQLQAHGKDALGLSGADMNSILAYRREVKTIDYGYVGDIEWINTSKISMLIRADIAPVFCALTHDNKGQLLNTNADTIASMLAEALSEEFEVRLFFGFEKNGVLYDVNDDDSVMSSLTFAQFQELKSAGQIHLGMIPKLDNAFYAMLNGAKEVYIGHVDALNDLDHFSGTKIC